MKVRAKERGIWRRRETKQDENKNEGKKEEMKGGRKNGRRKQVDKFRGQNWRKETDRKSEGMEG